MLTTRECFFLPGGQKHEIKVSKAIPPLEAGGQNLSPAPGQFLVAAGVPGFGDPSLQSLPLWLHSRHPLCLSLVFSCHFLTRAVGSPLGPTWRTKDISSSQNPEFNHTCKDPFSNEGNSYRCQELGPVVFGEH